MTRYQDCAVRTAVELAQRQVMYAGRKALRAQPISTRGSGQPNSLNVIQIETSTITIAQHQWRTQSGAFDLFSTERFVRTDSGWTRA